MEEIQPTKGNVRQWLMETLRHSNHMMYYSERLGIGKNDPELPHDLAGPYNKLEWDVIYGCSLGYGNLDHHDEKIFQLTKNSVYLHNSSQYHHRMWDNISEEASADDLKFGALDTICALLENRPYFESFNSIESLRRDVHLKIKGGSEAIKVAKLQWIDAVSGMMMKVERPDIDKIVTPDDFPNIGIVPKTYDEIARRMQKCLKMLRDKGYNL